MDNKGFISIEYLFSIFVILIITLPLLFLSQSAIQSSFDINDNVMHRVILDDVANSISQVDSNGEGYSKSVKLPSQWGYYEITAENKMLTIEFNGKKGQMPLPISNFDSKYKLHSGKSYVITKNSDGRIVIR